MLSPEREPVRTVVPCQPLQVGESRRGARFASVDALRVGDYDERDRRIRLRASTTRTRQALWVDLPDVLADALEASLGPREDRDVEEVEYASLI